MIDWLAKLLDLPKFFSNSSDGNGGGFIQGTASESMLIAILAAREQTVKNLRIKYPNLAESEIRGKLVMYSSDQSNSAIEKTSRLAAVNYRSLPTDYEMSLRGNTLQMAIEQDIENEMFPFACIATFGTTETCAFDDLNEIGPICEKHNIWLHIDAAYAGSALCCPEFRSLMHGIEYADSFNFNLHKWMMVNFDCSAMWFKDTRTIVESFAVDRIYLQHHIEIGSTAPEYRHWEIPLGRRFRALKVWFTLRIVGAEQIRENIRNHVRLANKFALLIENDNKFKIVAKPVLGIVCFRMIGNSKYTKQLLDNLMERKIIYVIPTKCHNQLAIRFVVNGLQPSEQDIEFAFNEITMQADLVNKQFMECEPLNVNNVNYLTNSSSTFNLLHEVDTFQTNL